MRVWNEIATVILFSVVFLAILKSKFDWLFGVLGLIFLTIILIFSVKLYKKWRERK
jgi:putative membrane protein